MRRMAYSPAAGGGPLSGALKVVGGFVGGLFKSKAARAAAAAAKAALKNPLVQTGLIVGGGEIAGALMAPGSGGGGGGGASGGWTGGRRRRGITATELRGFRKVANLLHKEGMVVKRARRGK